MMNFFAKLNLARLSILTWTLTLLSRVRLSTSSIRASFFSVLYRISFTIGGLAADILMTAKAKCMEQELKKVQLQMNLLNDISDGLRIVHDDQKIERLQRAVDNMEREMKVLEDSAHRQAHRIMDVEHELARPAGVPAVNPSEGSNGESPVSWHHG